MNADQIIRAAIPGASNEVCDYILWSRTPFPIGAITPKQIYRAARSFHRATVNGIQLCELCDSKVARKDAFACDACEAFLRKHSYAAPQQQEVA